MIDNAHSLVVISKHLCGAATDLCLNSLLNTLREIDSVKLKGIVIALCCHHKCDIKAIYTSKEYLSFLGISSRDFSLIKSASAWYTCHFKPTEGNDVNDDLLQERKKQIGWKCKRIIDYGRVKYLERFGFNAFLQYYVNGEFSPENIALVALNTSNITE